MAGKYPTPAETMYIRRDEGDRGLFLCFPDDWIVCVNIKLFYRKYFKILNSHTSCTVDLKYSCFYVSGLDNTFSHIWSYTAWSCQTYLSEGNSMCAHTRESERWWIAVVDVGVGDTCCSDGRVCFKQTAFPSEYWLYRTCSKVLATVWCASLKEKENKYSKCFYL